MSDDDAPLAHLSWGKGGHAEVVRVEGDVVELRSTTSAPPGARLEAVVGSATAAKIKSHGTKKEEDGSFSLKGRLIDATRELREQLVALCARE